MTVIQCIIGSITVGALVAFVNYDKENGVDKALAIGATWTFVLFVVLILLKIID